MSMSVIMDAHKLNRQKQNFNAIPSRRAHYLPGGEENRLLRLGVKSRDENGCERAVKQWVALEVLVQQALQSAWFVLGPIQGLESRPKQASVCTHPTLQTQLIERAISAENSVPLKLCQNINLGASHG